MYYIIYFIGMHHFFSAAEIALSKREALWYNPNI